MSAQPPPPQGAGPPAQSGNGRQMGTALLDALIAHGLGSLAGKQVLQSATPLESYPQLPNPDPESAPPLYGEPPGLGYLYAREPEFRQQALVETNPDVVRKMILRAMEVVATDALLPFNEEKKQSAGDALLKMAQAYLLIDPAVDAQGVPVASQMLTKGGAQIAGALASSGKTPGGGTPISGEGAHGQVKKGPAVGGHQEPPKVVAGQAAQLLQQMHQNAEQVLKGARASRPLPRPRPAA